MIFVKMVYNTSDKKLCSEQKYIENKIRQMNREIGNHSIEITYKLSEGEYRRVSCDVVLRKVVFENASQKQHTLFDIT